MPPHRTNGAIGEGIDDIAVAVGVAMMVTCPVTLPLGVRGKRIGPLLASYDCIVLSSERVGPFLFTDDLVPTSNTANPLLPKCVETALPLDIATAIFMEKPPSVVLYDPYYRLTILLPVASRAGAAPSARGCLRPGQIVRSVELRGVTLRA